MWREFCQNPSLNGLTEDNLKSHRMICRDHFKSNDFKSNQIEGLTNDAVPSIRKNIKIHSTNTNLF